MLMDIYKTQKDIKRTKRRFEVNKNQKMKYIILVLLLTTSVNTQSQTLKGTLKQHAGQQISLTGFNYYKTLDLATTVVDSLGNFSLNYPKNYKGMGVLKTQDNSSLVIALTTQNISLKGNHLKEPDSLVFANSTNNTNFNHYAKAQGLYGNALSALKYLDDLYQKEPLFSNQTRIKIAIEKEQYRIKKEDADFIASLDKTSYVRWFIPYRKLIQEMPSIVKTKPQRIPEAIQQFRAMDFNHPNFKTSGLFKELIEGHYMLLENMGQPLDSVYSQMNLSTQHLIDNLQQNDSLLNTVGSNLFNYLEKRSLFKASEFLSVSLLNNKQCALEANLAAKLESYRKMKVGNIAPEIELDANKKLSDFKTNKLVVFGASWCPTCEKANAGLKKYENAWKTNNVEIIYISIDTDKTAFNEAYKNTPWQTYCDYKGWDTQAAKDYYITGTPSYFLLDDNNKILVRPNSVEHANAWINR